MTTTRVKARYVIGYDGQTHRTMKDAEVVYRGDTCNCQARLTIKSKTVVALVLRSAC